MPSLPAPAPEPAWEAIGRLIDDHHRFLLATHENPDGDGLGAQVGLWSHLHGRGKDVRIVNADPLGDRYAFLGEHAPFETYDPAAHDPVLADREVVFLLDMSRRHRLGRLEGPLTASPATVVCIDHHPFEEEGMADLFGVDVTAAATGLLVYELIRALGHRPDRAGALGLYVSLLTDTGSFRFSNSDPRAHRAAAELLEQGLEPSRLYDAVYGNWSPGRMALTGRVLTDLRVHADGRVVVVPVSRALLEETGALPEEAEGLVDLARNRAGCECLGLLLERADGSVKASFRSQGRVNVREVARSFGGGGHVYAAGARVAGTFAEAVEAATQALVRAVEEAEA